MKTCRVIARVSLGSQACIVGQVLELEDNVAAALVNIGAAVEVTREVTPEKHPQDLNEHPQAVTKAEGSELQD